MRAPTTALVIGAGPAGMMAADTLAAAGVAVVLCDGMPSPARKLLMAGMSGLNLTHSEPFDALCARYGAAAGALRPALEAFPPEALRAFAADLGQETFVGSSGRVFPTAMKAAPLARAWLRRLEARGVVARWRTRFAGFAETGVRLVGADGAVDAVAADAIVLALGGASWPRLGSDGGWVASFREAGVAVVPLAPANCGLRIAWPADLLARHEGAPIQNVRVTFEDETVAGEMILTRHGLEGAPVYALAARLRAALERGEDACVTIDLKPDLAEDALAARLARARARDSLANALRKAGLSPGHGALARASADGPFPVDPFARAARLKRARLRVAGVCGLERAISSSGGVAFAAIDARFMLRDKPGVFVAGEMLDWDAPTGGYLLQACFATGRAAGVGARDFLARRP